MSNLFLTDMCFSFHISMGNITYSLQKARKTPSNISVDHLSQALELTDKKQQQKMSKRF